LCRKNDEPVYNNPYGEKEHPPEDIAGRGDFTPDETGEPQLSQIKNELEQKRKEAAELYERLLRKQAELENYRKRVEKDKSELIKFANENLVNDLLPVMDDFERAIQAAESIQDPKVMREGIKLIFSQLQAVLSKAGLEGVSALGEKFDPTKHEAVRLIESHEHEDYTVLEEVRKGYTLNKRILRPSMVAVAKNKTPETQNANADKSNYNH
jgi:molecular chaperone GrpE